MKNRFRVAFLALPLFCAFQVPAPSAGQAYSVYSHSACNSGRGGTGVAAPCDDASAIYFNPAALSKAGKRFGGGVDLVSLGGRFTPDDEGAEAEQRSAVIPIPHLYGSIPLTERVSAGLGVFFPYGLQIDWPADFRGGFSGYHGEVSGMYVQPTLSMRVLDGLDVGGGIDVVQGRVRIDQALDLSTENAVTDPEAITFGALGIPEGTAFAEVKLEATTWATGWHLGALLRLSDRFSLGARYLAEVTNEFESGSANFVQRSTGIVFVADNPLGVPAGTSLDAMLAPQFDPGARLASQSVSTTIVFPAQAVIGAQLRPTPSTRLLVDYMWTDWSAFREVAVEFDNLGSRVLIQDYEDTGTIRVGGEVDFYRTLTARVGYSYNPAAAPDVSVTPLLPEGARSIIYGGLGGRVKGDWYLDVFVDSINEDPRRGRLLPRLSRAITAEELNEGTFNNSGMEFGASISFRPES